MSYRRFIQVSLALFLSACAHGAGGQSANAVQYAGADEGTQLEGRSLTSVFFGQPSQPLERSSASAIARQEQCSDQPQRQDPGPVSFP